MADSNPTAVEALKWLRSGDLGHWWGITPQMRRQQVEMVFGNTGADPDGAAFLGEELCAFRDYPASDFAPFGFTIWFAGDAVGCVQINSPNFVQPLDSMLGQPEAIAPSRLKANHQQWIYAHRGLTAHVKRGQTVSMLYCYAPTTVEEFLQSGLSRVEIRRIRLT